MMGDSEHITLVNKVVRVVNTLEGIDNTGIISFMYPSFLVRDEIFFDHDHDVIYTGKYKSSIRQELEHGTRSFIALCSTGLYDVDFTNKETIIKVLYSRLGKDISEDEKKILENMSWNDFWNHFKKSWVLGKSHIEGSGKKMTALISKLGKQRYDILKAYFDARDSIPDSTIFSSVLGFIERSMDSSRVSSQNGLYLKSLQDFKNGYQESISTIINSVYTMRCVTDEDREYRTLWLLMQLGKGNAL